MELVELLFCFFKIGLLSFGGGYSVLPLIEEYVVLDHGWLTYDQYTDLLTISEITPGPIALNAASFTGYIAGGWLGAAAATFGCVLPSVVLVSVLAALYLRYREGKELPTVLAMLRPAVCAIIFSSFLTVALLAFFDTSELSGIPESSLDLVAVGLFAASLLLLKCKKINPVFVILGAGVLGIFLY